MDVERASGIRYSERAFLLQLRVPGEPALLVDPETPGRTVGPLATVLSERPLLFHAASQDLPSLRELGIHPTSLVDTELAVSATWDAARAPASEAELAVTMAAGHVLPAYQRVALKNIQIHGGIGFTWEHPAHLYFKRAKSSELLFGDPTYHRELLAQRIGI